MSVGEPKNWNNDLALITSPCYSVPLKMISNQ